MNILSTLILASGLASAESPTPENAEINAQICARLRADASKTPEAKIEDICAPLSDFIRRHDQNSDGDVDLQDVLHETSHREDLLALLNKALANAKTGNASFMGLDSTSELSFSRYEPFEKRLQLRGTDTMKCALRSDGRPSLADSGQYDASAAQRSVRDNYAETLKKIAKDDFDSYLGRWDANKDGKVSEADDFNNDDLVTKSEHKSE